MDTEQFRASTEAKSDRSASLLPLCVSNDAQWVN